MNQVIKIIFLFISSSLAFGQNSIDDAFSQRKMKKDLKIFKQIRKEANSGLHKYRSREQIDSLYNWADQEITRLHTYRDFYNLISAITDFEGSTHNTTSLPKKLTRKTKNEKTGYFPIPIKIVENTVCSNLHYGEIPVGAEIISINNKPVDSLIPTFYKYYTTDGDNKTGKQIGINRNFSIYYRYQYGAKDSFKIVYKSPSSEIEQLTIIEAISYASYKENFKNRNSYTHDRLQNEGPEENELYQYKQIDDKTGLLTLNSFSMGNEETDEHKTYKNFLDSTFTGLQSKGIENLIVDVRNNGGGTDPNDLVTYSYLTSRNFQESKQVWISFQKIPMLKHYNSTIPVILRPFGIGKYNKLFQERFPTKKENRYYISSESSEMRIRKPNKKAFKGQIYLLISPRVASAGSLFAAMVAGNENTITIGEETMGGYYGHNGHTTLEYVLPKSKIITSFSIDNIEQDVPQKANQSKKRGIIPKHEIPQTFEDFLQNHDTQLAFTLDLINSK